MPFLVLEGLDGAGKSTQINMLREYLTARGHRCRYIHFPRFDAPVYGDLIARFLRGELGELSQVNPYLVALFYAGDRAEAAETVSGWLSEGWVIADRYVYSNIGYQCAKIDDAAERERLRRWILDLEYGYYRIPQPDLSLFLDVPFSFTESRLSAARTGSDRDYLHGGADIHESSLDLQRRVRQVYLDSAEKDPSLRVVDCAGENGAMASAESIFERIVSRIGDIL